jgi:hypothetical protein
MDVNNMQSGFAGAININAQENQSQDKSVKIPLLVKVPDWSTNPSYPFVDGVANYITMQGAPLTDKNVTEISRMLVKGGKVGLWIDKDMFKANINKLAVLLGTTPKYSSDDPSCIDEFGAQYSGGSYEKICLTKENS